MADNSLAARAEGLQPNADTLNTDRMEQNDLPGHSNDVYRTQDIYQLISAFIGEARKVLPCDGIEYREDRLGLYFVEGTPSQERCDYTVRLGEQMLGKVCFTREHAFGDTELALIETLVAGLVLPLRNAIQYQKAVRFALRDSLTGLKNGNACYDSLGQEVERAQRYKIPFSLLLVNMDNFGEINQQYGHDAGNAILVEVARRLEQETRNSDIIFRKGGDEFLVFLPNTDRSAARIAAERFKHGVLSAPCVTDDAEIRFTTSIGVVTVLPDDSTFTLIDRADKALYHAKILGKDRIQTEPCPQSLVRE